MIMNNDIKTQLCKDDFYFMLENAMLQAGGGIDIDRLKKMTLFDIANILPQNGIRMVYMPEKHMNSVKIVWEDPKQPKYEPSGKREDGPLPKKKQLLCDQLDRGEDEEFQFP
jgi:hypothetical protein